MSRGHSRRRPRRNKRRSNVPRVVRLVYEREAQVAKKRGESAENLRTWAERKLSRAKVRRAVDGRCFSGLERAIDGWINRPKNGADDEDGPVASHVVERAVASRVVPG